MPFVLQPANAYTIDITGIIDVERERLKVTFEDGRELLFAVAESANATYPLLRLDSGTGAGANRGDAGKLIKHFAELFYKKNVARSATQRMKESFRRTFTGRRPSYAGWTYDRVQSSMIIELFGGTDAKPSSLCVGRLLVVSYGTEYSNPIKDVVPWGRVASIESYVVQPRAVHVPSYA